jgi:hypothetical protein
VEVTGEPVYLDLYVTRWDDADTHLIDRADGSWHHPAMPDQDVTR